MPIFIFTLLVFLHNGCISKAIFTGQRDNVLYVANTFISALNSGNIGKAIANTVPVAESGKGPSPFIRLALLSEQLVNGTKKVSIIDCRVINDCALVAILDTKTSNGNSISQARPIYLIKKTKTDWLILSEVSYRDPVYQLTDQQIDNFDDLMLWFRDCTLKRKT